MPPGDAEALAEAMRQLLSDAPRSRAMGERGRQRIAERFSIERTVEDTEALYREIL